MSCCFTTSRRCPLGPNCSTRPSSMASPCEEGGQHRWMVTYEDTWLDWTLKAICCPCHMCCGLSEYLSSQWDSSFRHATHLTRLRCVTVLSNGQSSVSTSTSVSLYSVQTLQCLIIHHCVRLRGSWRSKSATIRGRRREERLKQR